MKHLNIKIIISFLGLTSILTDIEVMPKGILFWRSATHWIGGMGIIVLTVAILPMLGIGGMQLFMAEAPGPSADKMHPRITETAKRLGLTYFVLKVKIYKIFKSEEFKYYFFGTIGITILITVIIVNFQDPNLVTSIDHPKPWGETESAFRHAAFQVTSILTTTGFVTA